MKNDKGFEKIIPERGLAMFKDFKKFISRGNVLDLAVGVIIGAAFGKIVSSLVADIVTPLISILIGGINLQTLASPPIPSLTGGEPITIAYGLFLQAIIDFLIISLAVFLFVRLLNRFKKKEEAKPAVPPAPPKQEVLLEEIRDLLKKLEEK